MRQCFDQPADIWKTVATATDITGKCWLHIARSMAVHGRCSTACYCNHHLGRISSANAFAAAIALCSEQVLVYCNSQPFRILMQACISGACSNAGRTAYLDVLDGIIELGDDNIVKGIDAAVGGLDGIIQREKSCLQAGQLNQQVHCGDIRLQHSCRSLEDRTKGEGVNG